MKIDHVAINVQDLEDAKIFFEKYFGGKANRMYHNPRTGLRTYFMTFDNDCRLELMNRPGINPTVFNPLDGGLIHLSFALGSKEAVDSLTTCLAKAGYEILDGPRTTGDGYYESSVKGFEHIILELTI